MSFLAENFPSKYLKATDADKPMHLTIAAIGLEVMRDGLPKPAVSFKETDKKLILNKTNSITLSVAFGGNEKDWSGKKVRLVAQMVDFSGKQVGALRIQIPDSSDRDTGGDLPF